MKLFINNLNDMIIFRVFCSKSRLDKSYKVLRIIMGKGKFTPSQLSTVNCIREWGKEIEFIENVNSAVSNVIAFCRSRRKWQYSAG